MPDEWWKRTDEIHEPVRIGEGLDAAGVLGPEPMERALETIELYAHFCRATGIDDVRAVATSAIRDATNRDEFLRRAALDVQVLSPEEEARYGYLAAVNSTTLTDGVALDLGGGSMQLTRVEDRQALDMRSWPLGAVRMTERFLDRERVKPKQLKALRAHVAEALEDAPWLERRRRAGRDRRHRPQPRRRGRDGRRPAVVRRPGLPAAQGGARRARRGARRADARRARRRAGHQARARRPDPGRRASSSSR